MAQSFKTLLTNALNGGVVTREQLAQLNEADLDRLGEVQDAEGMRRFFVRRFETPAQRIARLQEAHQQLEAIIEELQLPRLDGRKQNRKQSRKLYRKSRSMV